MTDAEIESFALAFEDCSLPKSEWTHAKHLLVALWYLSRHRPDEATRRVRDGIRRYNRSQGNRTGYHETITLAWIAVIERFLRRCDRDRPISTLAEELLAECGETGYLLHYYSREVLLSDEARRRFVPPDLVPIA